MLPHQQQQPEEFAGTISSNAGTPIMNVIGIPTLLVNVPQSTSRFNKKVAFGTLSINDKTYPGLISFFIDQVAEFMHVPQRQQQNENFKTAFPTNVAVTITVEKVLREIKNLSESEEPSETLSQLIEKDLDDVEQQQILANYVLGERLNFGTYGAVRKGIRKSDNKEFAVKIINKQELAGTEYANVASEVHILNHLVQSRCVPHADKLMCPIDIVGWDDDRQDYVHVVSELCVGGTLGDEVERRGGLGEERACRILTDVVKGLNVLHGASIIHRNLCASKIVFEGFERTRVKIIGFSHAEYFKGVPPGCMVAYGRDCGSLTSSAPEMLLGNPYGIEVDFWSAGVLLYYMLTGKLPFQFRVDSGERVRDFMTRVVRGKIRWDRVDNVSEETKDCVARLMCVDARRRLNGASLFRHPWIRAHGHEAE